MAPFPRTTIMAHQKPEYAKGRPSGYDPAYCTMVIEHMAKGYSLTSFAGSIQKGRDTVYGWIARYGAFADAVARARSARITALETKLLTARRGGEVAAAIFALKNAEPDEWKDVKFQHVDHNLDIKQLSDAQLYAIAAQGKAADVLDGEFTRVDPQQTDER